jgi:uncharacterized repeat protein (TIGR01451 family)/gliding motility-associated-like protein
MKKTLLLLMFCLVWLGLRAQSPTYINDEFNINAGSPVLWYGDVTFGPNAVVYLEDGAIATFYGKNMSINATAKFIALPGNNQTGTGKIIFKQNNPMVANYPQQQTLNGGYGTGSNPSFINIEIDNAQGVSLTGNVRVANQVIFTQGHLYLNNFNVALAGQAIFYNYDVNKHVVTNGTGVITKEAMATNNSFLFPISVEGADYTPVTVTNSSAARNISVQVKDYTNSTAIETTFANKGIDRTWQISSNITGLAKVSLQHNAANNTNGKGTNQSLFNNALSYVSQQLSSGVWSQSCAGNDGGTPISINQADFTLPATIDPTAYFTKTTVTCADLSIIKTVNSTTPKVGVNLTFTITAKNLGVVAATGVVVTDILPSGYTYVSNNPSVGAYNSSTGIWTVGNLAVNASATLNIVATVKISGNYANTASVTGDQQDSNLTNNSATATPTPDALQANLGITKTVDVQSPVMGDNVVFTLTATNAGPDNATNARVIDLLPSGYTFVSATVTSGAYNNSTGVWSIGTLANGGTAKLTVSATVKTSGVYTNTASVTADELDPVGGNNTASVTPTPNAALVNLSIEKTVAIGKGTAIGDEFDYTIVVKNIGSQLATGISATDVMPLGITYLASNAGYGTATYNTANKTVTWSIGNLAVGASITLTIKAKAEMPGVITNTATVTSTQPDSDNANNTSMVKKEVLDLTFPNVITPNGDGKNDVFKVLGLNAYPENSMSIYNRWGNEVWRSRGATYQNEWSGNGLNEGTYFYVIKLKDRTGTINTVNGWVMLLKDK